MFTNHTNSLLACSCVRHNKEATPLITFSIEKLSTTPLNTLYWRHRWINITLKQPCFLWTSPSFIDHQKVKTILESANTATHEINVNRFGSKFSSSGFKIRRSLLYLQPLEDCKVCCWRRAISSSHSKPSLSRLPLFNQKEKTSAS